MSITQLVELAVITDLEENETLRALTPKHRDHDGRLGGDDNAETDEARITIAVSAIDQGEFHQGSGIRKILVQIELRSNALAEDATAAELDSLAEIVTDRVQPSSTFPGHSPREGSSARIESYFSNANLKVFGIQAASPEPREMEDLIRVRTIARTFICAQLA